MYIRHILILILFSIVFPVYADNYQYTGKCSTSRFSESLEQCLDAEIKFYDNILNKLYRDLIQDDADNTLRDAERSWIKFKEDDCDDIASKVNMGKTHPFIYKACIINKTKARIEDLKRPSFYFEWFKKID